jgi:hypothetical protein
MESERYQETDEVDDYDLADFEMPDDLRDLTFDTATFKQIAKKIKLSPEQASELWDIYTNNQVDTYRQAKEKVEQAKLQAELDEAERQEEEREQQSLANIEKKLETHDGYSLTPEEASALLDKIYGNPDHKLFSRKVEDSIEQENAHFLVLRLMAIKQGLETSVKGYLSDAEKEREQRTKDILGYDPHAPRRSAYGDVSQSEKQPFRNPDDIGWGDKEVKSSHGGRIEDSQFTEINDEG